MKDQEQWRIEKAEEIKAIPNHEERREKLKEIRVTQEYLDSKVGSGDKIFQKKLSEYESLAVKEREAVVMVLDEIKSETEKAREDIGKSDGRLEVDSKAKLAFFVIGQKLSVRMQVLNDRLQSAPILKEDIEKYKMIFYQIAKFVVPVHLKYEILRTEQDTLEHPTTSNVPALPEALSHSMKHFLQIYDGEEGDLGMLEDGLRDQLIELCASLYHWNPKYEIKYLQKSKTSKFSEKIESLEKLEPLSKAPPSNNNPAAKAFNEYVELQFQKFKDFVDQEFGGEQNYKAKFDELLEYVSANISILK